MSRGGWKVGWFLVVIALVAAVAGGAWAQGVVLEPGLYGCAGGGWARVGRMQGGALAVALWQGSRQGPGPGGFMLVGRLLPAPGGRLVGSFQASPTGCCLVRGRWEIKALGPRKFAFTLLAPAQGPRAWPALEGMDFALVSPARAMGLEALKGRWRMRYCYRLNALGRQVVDTAEWVVVLEKDGKGGLKGRWEGAEGQLRVSGSGGLVELSYEDRQEGFSLQATLSPVGGGLGLVGPMHSSLGSGTMVMVREGLPALPPGCEASEEGELSGLWVDERTGDDFFEITGSAKGFSFLHYGGSRSRPRYLSRGSAVAVGGGELAGDVADAPGYCCGNQGRMVFRVVGPGVMEVRSAWWPKGARPKKIELSAPYRIRRVGAGASPAPGQVLMGAMVPARPGLPGLEQGSIRAVVVYQPPSPARTCTIFSQGGYRRWLELFIDPEGRPGARISTREGDVILRASAALAPGQVHELWLIYRQGARARLLVDGRQVASQPFPAARTEAGAVYVLGASRRSGRDYSGELRLIQLWSTAQNPADPQAAELALGPVGLPPASPPRPAARRLWRLWHPGRLVHAYAADQQRVSYLKTQGFVDQTPVCSLPVSPGPGLVAMRLWLSPGGWQVLAPRCPGKDFKDLGEVGYVYRQPTKDALKLLELAGTLADPLRGGPRKDVLYTTRADQLEAMEKAGYTHPRVVGWVLPAGEGGFSAPVLYTWEGAWRGEGWGKFFLVRRGRELMMFWYYADFSGPHYFGRYRIGPGGATARGMAVGRPGPRASYYRQELELELNSPSGPRMRLKSWRVAVGLDDGRLVHFSDPQPVAELLIKTCEKLPPREARELARLGRGPGPRRMLEQALERARREGRLVER